MTLSSLICENFRLTLRIGMFELQVILKKDYFNNIMLIDRTEIGVVLRPYLLLMMQEQ